MAGGSARAVTFTLNNWSGSDYEKIQSYAEKPWCLNLTILHMKTFDPPKVIFFMNVMPDMDALSKDRYDIKVVSKESSDMSLVVVPPVCKEVLQVQDDEVEPRASNRTRTRSRSAEPYRSRSRKEPDQRIRSSLTNLVDDDFELSEEILSQFDKSF